MTECVCVFVGNRAISLTCVLTPCRVVGVCVILMTLGAIGAAVWAVGQSPCLSHTITQTAMNIILKMSSIHFFHSVLLYDGGRHRALWWWVHCYCFFGLILLSLLIRCNDFFTWLYINTSQSRWIPPTNASEFLTQPRRDGGKSAPLRPTSFWQASAVRKWVLSGEKWREISTTTI